ncbi:hypothetical protein [Haloarcula amylolytica]|uniref:Uncharacterized protein n=1 Tax=Haloarcula amylolytica JCM 13557 TaxID=1227452 RepID=M0KB29_9EURY|nr:hypothetical protein [Haloarcula amylolytica]EMA17030.1 hypothetical protein C442_17210 [Haloarcula amylolytica JCM 13557]
MGERIHLVVSEAQKERWDAFADGHNDIDDRSDLIRTAVETYIASADTESDLPEEIEDKFDDLLVHFERLESRVSFANESFETLLEHQLDADEVEDIVEYHTQMLKDEIERYEQGATEDGSDE